MPIRSVTLRILGESKDALAKLAAVNKEADKLDARKVTVKVGVDLKQSDITDIKAKLSALSKLKTEMTITIKADGLMETFAKIKAELAAIRTLVKGMDLAPNAQGIVELAKTNAALTAMNVAMVKVTQDTQRFGAVAKTTNTVLGGLFAPGGGFGRWGAFFGGKVMLFGGLAAIGTIHLLIDAIVEVAAVLIPVTAALTAFGIAGSDAAVAIYRHMTNLHTVMDATGRAIPPMTGGMEKLHKAVQPEVYQIFGDALTVMNSKTGVFTKLAEGAAQVVAHFAARMTVAINSGKGFGVFVKNAIPDMQRFFDSFASLFRILGSLLHVMPGYARILLAFGQTFLQVASWVVKLAEPIIGLGLYVHGFIVWAGLGASAAFALGRGLVWLGTTAIGQAIKGILTYIAELVTMTATGEGAAAATMLFSDALASMQANPLIWIGAAIGAIIGLVFWMGKSESATQKWGDSLQKTVDQAASVTEGITKMRTAEAAAALNLNHQQTALTHATQGLNEAGKVSWQVMAKNAAAYSDQSRRVADSTAVTKKFNNEINFSVGRMDGLAKAYGGQKNAMALVNAAGITMSEWQDHSAEGWAILVQRINATIAGYKAMGQTGGTLNNDLAVMDRNITDQYQAMQKLNQNWDQFISDITSGQNNFDNMALGFKTLESNATKVTASLGRAHFTFAGLGTAVDGLTKRDLALNQAFTTQVGNINTLIDSWRTAGVASNLFNTGVKDAIAPMVRYARGSKEATAQLVALAQEAGYTGPVVLKDLVKWLGNTHGALSKVKSVTNQATIQESLLTGAMQAQGTYISNILIRDIQQAEMAYFGVTSKAQAYGNAIARFGKNSVEAKAKGDALTNSIIESGVRAHETTNQMAALISKILGIPLHRAISITEHGEGKFSITGTGLGPIGAAHGRPMATGGLVTGGIPHMDSVLIKAMPGEVVVPTKLVDAGFVDHLRGLIPGFAAGGVVQGGDKLVLSGQSAVNYDANFISTFTNRMENSILAALRAMAGSGIAIAKYAEKFHGLPYVWGGTSLSTGADCSGFTQAIYEHFGINPPRTSEAQGGWVRKGPPQPGGLAFYHSPAGGPDPGHVAIIDVDPSRVISQGGGLGPQHVGLHSMPLLFTGIPPTGFGGPGGKFGGNAPISGGVEAVTASLARARGWGNQWGAINYVEMREAGWNMHARNPSSGAYGIAQFINGPGEYYQWGGNPNTAFGQAIAFLNYIGGTYGSPIRAAMHERAFGWYGGGISGAVFNRPTLIGVGEMGPERVDVTPLAHGGAGRAGGGGDTYNIFVLDESYSDAQAERLIKKVRKYKGRHGNQPTGIG